MAKSPVDEARPAAETSEASTSSARYLGHTVLIAAMRFFAGTPRTFDYRRARHAMINFAIATFLHSLVRVLPLPVA